jgi:hypothetical protein
MKSNSYHQEKKSPSSSPSRDQIIKAAWEAAVTVHKVEPVPPGWLSTSDFAEEFEVSESHAYNVLNSAHRKGKLEKKVFLTPLGGKLRRLIHYKPVDLD